MFELHRAGRSVLAGIAVAATVIVAAPGSASAGPQDDREAPATRFTSDYSAIKDSYIVVLKDSATPVDARVKTLAVTYGGTVTHTYRSAVRGFAVTMSAAQAGKLAGSPEVAPSSRTAGSPRTRMRRSSTYPRGVLIGLIRSSRR